MKPTNATSITMGAIKGEDVSKEIEVVKDQQTTPMALIDRAQAQGASIEQMQQLFELHLRYEANEARKSYNKAIADFKTKNIRIIKDTLVDFQTGKGRTTYKHAQLGSAVAQIISALCECGLSHSWKTTQDAQNITVTCKISHVDGHSEETSITAQPDQSGGKNSIQAIGSTITYLERYTLKAALGLAEEDDDGSASEQAPVETINDEQLANLEALIAEVKANYKSFCAYLDVPELHQLPAKRYNLAVDALESKRGK